MGHSGSDSNSPIIELSHSDGKASEKDELQEDNIEKEVPPEADGHIVGSPSFIIGLLIAHHRRRRKRLEMLRLWLHAHEATQPVTYGSIFKRRNAMIFLPLPVRWTQQCPVALGSFTSKARTLELPKG